MNNPLDLKEFKHYLNFKNNDVGRIQITEPVKFDGAEFVVEQNSTGYARDISYMSEEMDLEFYEGFWEQSDESYQLPNGLIVDKLGHAIEHLFKYNKDYGFQSQIEYILERNGIEFILGELNFEGAKTDELTYFYCKVVQNTKRALSKRREDTTINGFATEDLDGNEIEPLTTHNLLLKAKPVVQHSQWKAVEKTSAFEIQGIRRYFYPFFRQIINYGIADTVTSLFDFYNPLFGEESEGRRDCAKVLVQNELTDIKVEIRDLSLEVDTEIVTSAGESIKIVADYGASENDEDITQYVAYNSGTIGDNYPFLISNLNLDFELPYIPSGGILSIYVIFDAGEAGNRDISFRSISGDLSITATSTTIDTVVKAVRYGDLLRHSLKAINQMDIIAPELDEGGKYYDLFAFSGNLIRQRDDVPFYFDFKDRRENFQSLTNGDVQVNEDNAFALLYDKFYDNVDNGGFLTVPSDTFEMTYNQRYAVNLLEYKFKTYETDKDEGNTRDAVHTEAQFSINNTRVKNTKAIDVGDVFDVFSIESQRSQVYKETTALEGDDKVHCIDVVNLSPTARGGFTASMTHNINSDGNLQILKDSELPSWGLVGIEIGGDFRIDSDENNGDYIVVEIENTILTLQPVGFTPTFENTASTEVSYPFSNVQYTNRTNEGFDLIQNVLNPDNFGNLKYTIRRNLVEYEPYISTCASYIDENPKNTEFKNNGLLVTQFDDGEIYTENGDIILDEIRPAILSPRIYTTDVIAEYDDVLDLIRKYQDISAVGGFIRIQGNNGDIKRVYPQKLGYTWSTQVLNIIGEERVEDDVIVINKVGSIIYINEVGYSEDQLAEVFYEANGDFFTIYDANHIKIINFTKYNKFIVQEETFDNTTDLAQALIDL